MCDAAVYAVSHRRDTPLRIRMQGRESEVVGELVFLEVCEADGGEGGQQ